MISKLTVFNAMIGTMGFMPYADLTAAATNPYYAQGLEILAIESRDIQTRGWWFNTTYFTAVPGDNDFPCGILRIQGPDLDGLVIRGNSVYNFRQQEMLSTTVENVKAVVELEFDDLPPIAQSYVMARAVLAFQSSYDSTRSTSERWERKATETFVLMNTEDIKAKRANRLLSPSVFARVIAQRGQAGYDRVQN
jgi:DNA-binding transcriptional regulator YiaG